LISFDFLVAALQPVHFSGNRYLAPPHAARPDIAIPVPRGDGDCPTMALLVAPDTFVLGRFLFAILLIALALLTLLNVALALTIHVLRSLCGLLFRLLIAILLARLLFVFIFHS
jgi:hypothetical protein